ncbi:thiamine phosphate synthase [Paenimyroides ceti]
MKIITNPYPVADEAKLIHALFEEGMDVLHVRKPDYTKDEMRQLLDKISMVYTDRIALHSHHELGDSFGIGRFHFSENNRKKNNCSSVNSVYSTAVHDIQTFNVLNTAFSYAFLSPVFPSISKPGYCPSLNLFEQIDKRTCFQKKLVALGGINSLNILEVYRAGFDDVALLGAIWQNNNPIKEFKKCQKIARLYSH